MRGLTEKGRERHGRALQRWVLVVGGLLVTWQVIVWSTGTPHYILPPPALVAQAWWKHCPTLMHHLAITGSEIALGLALGTCLGVSCALLIGYFQPARRWLLPVVVASQAIPVFALAPLLVLWLGYGMGSKVAMATLIIFFPVTAAFLDGLQRTEPGWVDLAKTMVDTPGAGERHARAHTARMAILLHVRIPAALPALASGLRVATAVAPIGAVVGEWVGASAGLGYLMLHANGRMQIDLMFAALLTLALASVLLWFGVDAALRRALPWVPHSLQPD